MQKSLLVCPEVKHSGRYDVENLEYYVDFFDKSMALILSLDEKKETEKVEEVLSEAIGCYTRIKLIAKQYNINLKKKFPKSAEMFQVTDMFFR